MLHFTNPQCNSFQQTSVHKQGQTVGKYSSFSLSKLKTKPQESEAVQVEQTLCRSDCITGCRKGMDSKNLHLKSLLVSQMNLGVQRDEL